MGVEWRTSAVTMKGPLNPAGDVAMSITVVVRFRRIRAIIFGCTYISKPTKKVSLTLRKCDARRTEWV
jgi:hypothetical protein